MSKEWGELSIAGERMDEISDCFGRLSRCFTKNVSMQKKLTQQQKEQIYDNVCAVFCCACEEKEHCRQYNDYDNFSAAMELLKEQEIFSQADQTQEKQDFLERCIHAEDFLYTAYEELAAAKQSMQLKNRMAELRTVTGGQLREVSVILREFSEGIRRGKAWEKNFSGKLANELRKHHIEMENAVFMEDKNGMIQMFLTVRSKWSGCITAKEAAEAAGHAVGKRMKTEGNGTKLLTDRFEVIHLAQEAGFQVFTGVARLVKEGSHVSGDSFSVKDLPDSKLALMLSDGMGSGMAAQQESCMMIELLEEFLEAGFSVQASMNMVHSMFLTQAGEPSVVTSDLALLNLYNGMAEFYKAGAAPAYIKRGSSVVTVYGQELPAGMFFGKEEEPVVHKLYQGDYLIMITDGVLEAVHAENKDEMMEGYLSMLTVKNPQEMADRILSFAAGEKKERAKDDMTVLVAAVYEARKKRRFFSW
jgi:stage II sporulation protein E